MIVTDISDSYLTVDLLNSDGSSLKFALVFVGIANGSTLKEDSNMIYKKSLQTKKIFPYDCFQEEQICDVTISCVIDPYQFYLRISDNLRALNELHNRMILYYRKSFKKDFIYEPEKGMMCAYSLSDNTWRRAEIMNVIGDGKAEIFTLDYGETHVVHWDKIRKLDEEFFSLDSQVIDNN